MAHKHSIYDTDPHFKIDPATRAIQNESGKVTLMQYDHNSERFTFEIPRFIDGHDTSLCNLVTIHFDNVDSSTKAKNSDVYGVKDLQLSPASENVVIFSWLISDLATQFKGELKFSISFQCIADNGDLDYDWGTGVHYGITIGERIRNSEGVVQRNSDILSQWKNDLFGIGDTEEAKLLSTSQEQQSDISEAGQTQVDAVNARGAAVLDTIPDDYEALSALANENSRIKAGAIVLNAEGESIVVSDSANAYLSGMKLYGKSEQKSTTGINIFPQQSVEFTQELVVDLDTTHPAGKYTFSAIVKSTDTDSSGLAVMFKTNGEHVDTMFVSRSNGSERITYTGNVKGAFDRISFYASDGWSNSANDTATLTDILLTAGETVYEFEPYSGGKPSPSPEYPQDIKSVADPDIFIDGKNLIPYPYYEVTATKSGVTYQVNADGTMTLSGTPTAATSFILAHYTAQNLYVRKGCRYRFRALTVGGGFKKVYAYVSYNGGDPVYDVGQGCTLTPTEDGYATVCVVVSTNAGTLDNFVIEPQLELGTESTEYEPYKGQTLTIPRTLPGIPVTSGGNYTDSNGQQWICDEIDFDRGVYIQRIGSAVRDGSSDEYWYTINATGGVIFGHVLQDAASEGSSKKLLSSHFSASVTGAYNREFDSCYFYDKTLRICHMGIETLDRFRAWLIDNPVTILYALEVPIETPLSDAELLAFKALRSNKPATTILNDSGMFMSIDYVADTKTYIDNKIAEIIKNS